MLRGPEMGIGICLNGQIWTPLHSPGWLALGPPPLCPDVICLVQNSQHKLTMALQDLSQEFFTILPDELGLLSKIPPIREREDATAAITGKPSSVHKTFMAPN